MIFKRIKMRLEESNGAPKFESLFPKPLHIIDSCETDELSLNVKNKHCGKGLNFEIAV